MDVVGEPDATRDPPGRPAALKRLLERLAADHDAARGYEQLHLRLVTYFQLRFPAEAEALADEAIDRLARRLDEGAAIDNPSGYALGVARYLIMETAARHRKEDQAAREAALELELQVPDGESDPALPALRACLGRLDPESARLILEYYALDGGGARIERRQQMADRLGVSLNALRNRALRTRMALEKCVRARLLAQSAGPGGDISPKSDTSDMQRSRHDRAVDTYD